ILTIECRVELGLQRQLRLGRFGRKASEWGLWLGIQQRRSGGKRKEFSVHAIECSCPGSADGVDAGRGLPTSFREAIGCIAWQTYHRQGLPLYQEARGRGPVGLGGDDGQFGCCGSRAVGVEEASHFVTPRLFGIGYARDQRFRIAYKAPPARMSEREPGSGA